MKILKGIGRLLLEIFELILLPLLLLASIITLILWPFMKSVIFAEEPAEPNDGSLLVLDRKEAK